MARTPQGKPLPKNLDPRTLSLEDATQAVGTRLPADFDERIKFAEGDHWQDAAAWVGPIPKAGADGYATARDEIERAFTPQDVLAEVVGRHVDGVVGHEPQWALAPRRFMEEGEEPTAQETTAKTEAEALLTAWWDGRKVPGLLRRALTSLLWVGRAPLRLYVPRGLLVTETRDGTPVTGVKAATVDEALALIWPDDPLPEQATVLEDPETKRGLGIFAVAEDADRAIEAAAYLVYLATSGDKTVTVLRTVTEATPEASTAPAAAPGAALALPPGAIPYEFGGRLTMIEGCRAPLVSTVLLKQQRALNLARSMLPRNLVTSNFLERIFLGVQPPGTWVPTLNAQGEKIGETFKPAPYTAGPGSASFLQPSVVEGADGQQKTASASVIQRDPTSPGPSIEAAEALYATMLTAAHQRHILMTAAGDASGVALEQARADFKRSLDGSATVVVEYVQWLLETALAMAEAFAGTPGKYTSLLRAVVTPILDLGPVSPEERKQLDAAVASGGLSRQTAMQAGGIVDVDAELARIASQPDAQLATLKRQAEVMQLLTTAGLSLDGAAQLAGMSEEQVAIITAELDEDEEDGTTRDERGNPREAGENDDAAGDAGYAVGDRVRALVEHMPGMEGREGAVRIVRPGTPGGTYGVLFDGDTEIHKWYVEEELAPAGAEGGEDDMAKKKTKKKMKGMKH